MRKAYFGLIILISQSVYSPGDYRWWNAIHNWDGHTSWQNYMTISSAFMGPNALPVPDITKGRLDSTIQFETGGDVHFSTGDHTQDFFVRGYLPISDGKVALSIEVIPVEWFKTDTITRDMRASRGKSGIGKAGGDIYITTYVQVLKQHHSLPDLALRIALRTASGTNLGEARYTDGPGYYFDLSGGKSWRKESFFLNEIRLYAMSGLYVYQTFDILHLQNDCFLYGGGIDFHFSEFVFSQEVSGYSGYLKNGDKPLVYRSSLQWKKNNVKLKFSYQHSLRDFPAERIRLGVGLELSK